MRDKICMLVVLVLWSVVAVDVDSPKTIMTESFRQQLLKAKPSWDVMKLEDHPFRDYSDDDLKQLASLKLVQELREAKPSSTKKNILEYGMSTPPSTLGASLPSEYDWRETAAGSKCSVPVKDQGRCGSCYSFATLTMFSMRMCEAFPDKPSVDYSMQDLFACSKRTLGCEGGTMSESLLFLEEYGVSPLLCNPYNQDKPDPNNCSPERCTGSGKFTRAYCDPGTGTAIMGEEYIKQEIHRLGPVSVTMAIYYDFFFYNGGIYEKTTNTVLGYHAVVLLGWGTYQGKKYWIVQNSWGTKWGIEGYFKASTDPKKSGIYLWGYFCNPSST
jgi:cathepsin B